MVRSFIKETTNVGGSIGVIIPKEVCYAEGISKFQMVRIIIEPVTQSVVTETNQNADKGDSTHPALQGYPSLVKPASCNLEAEKGLPIHFFRVGDDVPADELLVLVGVEESQDLR